MISRSKYLDSSAKRVFDIAICAVILAPVLAVIALTALVTLLMEGRPAFFFQRRLGKNGILFRIAKIRTMYPHADPYRPSPKSDDRELVTATGRFLRKHRLDELPQVFSVLSGHMSVVGPRPQIPQAVSEYGRAQRRRLVVRPGVTGLWQVLADRNKPICDNMKYDLYYLRKASLRLDLKILLLTIIFVVRPTRKPRTYENSIYTYDFSVPN
jgi:lipopolysaccharide/colanic/teichoic acid biosynthesis glycosyltransferase